MRIAVWHNLPSGGGRRSLFYHVKGLVERGHEVEVWCPDSADRTFLPLTGIAEEHVVPLAKPIPAVPSGGGLRRALRVVRRAGEVFRILDEHGRACAAEISRGSFDVLFANSSRWIAAGPLGKYVQMPSVMFLQEPVRELYEARPVLPWVAIPAARRFWWSPSYLHWFVENLLIVQAKRIQVREERSNAGSHDLILVNSHFSREGVLRAYGLEARVCDLGVDTEAFRPLGLPRAGYVIAVGTMQRIKGADRAVRALAAIDSAIRPELVWVANYVDDAYYREVRTLADAAGVRLTLRKLISAGEQEELVNLLNRAALMLYTPRLEPLGLAPLEAGACGTPVVAIAEGGVRETVVDGVNGLLISDDDPRALAAAVVKLLDDANLAMEMGRRARQRVVENWTWDKSVAKLEEYLLRASRGEFSRAEA